MKPFIRTLLCLAAAVAAFAAAALFIVMSGVAETPLAGAVHAGVALPPVPSPATLVVRVQAAAQGLQVSGLLLREPDRVPAQVQDRVYSLDAVAPDRPLTWRALLTQPEAMNHA
ncbi:hypothetical protein QMA77_19530 [Pantoea ananatis]|uniref:hypothetical protein n=1 Tax=Pantoea ananas TaxID=553 RepID=UPI0024AD6B7B|nr:hypothetical protein [Pantoea ananatis]MDI6539117.1 hypothetical protein [Pantoea ananatis]